MVKKKVEVGGEKRSGIDDDGGGRNKVWVSSLRQESPTSCFSDEAPIKLM